MSDIKTEMPDQLHKMIPLLLSWYARDHRALPWRESPSPYHVWISEIMLQQTRVEAVKPYYHRFLQALPEVKDLANAPEDRLLKLWEGLGYYSRVRNLKKAAIQIEAEYGGQFPKTSEQLKKLAGIGSYTAGAIASICFGEVTPAVDGNVLRVLSRVRQDDRFISLEKTKKQVEEELKERMLAYDRLVNAAWSGSFNQSLMELGAMVCLPGGIPLCHKCPLQSMCKAHLAGCETMYPMKEAKKPRRIEEKSLLLLWHEGRFALRKRPSGGLLANMYELPSLEGNKKEDELRHLLFEHLPGAEFTCTDFKPLPAAKHIFSHVEWHMQGVELTLQGVCDEELLQRLAPLLGELIFVSPKDVAGAYPIPSAFSAYRGHMKI